MSKAIQVFNGTIWIQVVLTDEDVTVYDATSPTPHSAIADRYLSFKDGNDKVYMLCNKPFGSYSTSYMKFIQVDKNGGKKVSLS